MIKKSIEYKVKKGKIAPAFANNEIVIAMSSSDAYLPYLSVCLQSIVDNATPKKCYDIVIFTNDDMSYSKRVILDKYNSENISVRFYDPREIMKNVQMKVTHDNFHEVCYYRLAAPIVFKSYKKIIFTDVDLVCCQDIAQLANVDMENCAIAACIEPIWKYLKETNTPIKGGISIVDYSTNILKLHDVDKYYNTGVVLIDVQEFNKVNGFKKTQEAINTHNFIFQEQCALNYVFKDSICTLDSLWNVETFNDMRNSYNQEEIKIIHYPGLGKPWVYPAMEMGDIWWAYARKTPFYEEILLRMVLAHCGQSFVSVKHNNQVIIKFKYRFYRVLKHITWGGMHKKFKKKYNRYKAKIERK